MCGMVRRALVFSKEIDHFTVVCLVTWSLDESEAGVDLALIETSQLFLGKIPTYKHDNKIINVRKALTFLLKQGQLQPHFHSKAR